MSPIYLEPEECVVLLRALAKAVQSDDGILPNDATALSRMVWDSETAAPIQRSLATALAEATYAPQTYVDQMEQARSDVNRFLETGDPSVLLERPPWLTAWRTDEH